MSHDVKVELSARDFPQVQVRSKDAFAVAQWPGEHLAQRRHDHATAADQYRIGRVTLDRVIVVRAVGASEVLAGAQYEASSFKSYVLHRGLPRLAVVNRGSAP